MVLHVALYLKKIIPINGFTKIKQCSCKWQILVIVSKSCTVTLLMINAWVTHTNNQINIIQNLIKQKPFRFYNKTQFHNDIEALKPMRILMT